MIADVWQKRRFHTFLVTAWYDWNSCGANMACSYVTVDASTGKEVTYASLIRQSDEPKLSALMLKYLRNESEGWVENAARVTDYQAEQLISLMDGCALLKEGLLIYYYPYTIGCGADGEFIAIIPYEVLKANGIRFKAPYHPSF